MLQVPTDIALPFLEPAYSLERLPANLAECSAYRARLARNEEEILAALRLRFVVFNLELAEGLESSYADGYDRDPFDEICDHLIVEHIASRTIVGTYRLQSGDTAAKHLGYYSEQEFIFTAFEGIRSGLVELGRACVHREHRTSEVLNLLWRGIARYALQRGGRFLIGCCSLTSQEPAEGLAVFEKLQPFLTGPELRTRPTAAYEITPSSPDCFADVEVPRLLRAYLALGARICGAPAIDRAFRTIDFLTLLDLHTLHPRVARRFL